MSFAAHGNWCGPGWSARQWKDAKDLTEEDKLVPAVDELDQACKEHDIGIAEGDPYANEKFYNKAAAASWFGLTLAQFVKIGGPPLQNYLRGGEEVNKEMTTRGKVKKAFDEAAARAAKERARKKKQQTERQFRHDENRVYNAEDEEEKFATIEELKATEDTEVLEAMVDMNGDFETPDRPTPVMAPKMTREDNPLRVGRNVRDSEGNIDSLSNLLDREEDATMEDIEMAPMAQRAASGDSNATTRGRREAIVKYNTRAEMGIFTETRTAYLPLTVYFSINRATMQQSVPLHFRVDWPKDIFFKNTLAQQSLAISYTDNAIRTSGLSNDMACFGLRDNITDGVVNAGATVHRRGLKDKDPSYNRAQLIPFPTTVKGSTAAVAGTALAVGTSSFGSISDDAAIPAYRKWYTAMYQYAHCMETDWKVTYFSGESNEEFQNLRVYEGIDCESDGNTDTIPTTNELGNIDHWPYLKKHDIGCRTEENSMRKYTISGKWYPGREHPMKMVANEEDLKTWVKTTGSDFGDRAPAYREDVTLLHYAHPDSTNQASFVNVRIDLRYKVQFRDLSNRLRWPRIQETAVSLNSHNCIQRPTPNGVTGVTGQPERVTANTVATI